MNTKISMFNIANRVSLFMLDGLQVEITLKQKKSLIQREDIIAGPCKKG